MHQAELERRKWLCNPNRDMGYRRLKRQVVLPVPCDICGGAITHFGRLGGSHAFEHITPLSVARNNDPANLRHAHKELQQRERSWPITARVGASVPDVIVTLNPYRQRSCPTRLAIPDGSGTLGGV
jgi:hypothetical protein